MPRAWLDHALPVAEWIYFLHPPRDDFAATMTDAEEEVWRRHFSRLQQLTRDGVLVLAGPTLGKLNTGIVVFEADDEEAARELMNHDPVVSGGYAQGELRPFRILSCAVATRSSAAPALPANGARQAATGTKSQ